MKSWILLSLATLAALSAAACVGPYAKPQLAAGSTCRAVARPDDGRLLTFCGTSAAWAEFDRWAASAGVTCRSSGAHRETCMNEAQWTSFARGGGRPLPATQGFAYPNTSILQMYPQTSLGGGTIWDNQITR